jgi:soluble lytic murein transglycosylase-like protein
LIAECILAYSSSFGVDARLVTSLIQHESNFNPRSTSHAGAQGLGQLMPETWRSLGISDPYDIVQNVYGTVRTIRGHLERQGKESKDTYEQLVRALAAYNAGPGAVKKYGGLPPYAETEAYVERVMRTYFKLSGQSK